MRPYCPPGQPAPTPQNKRIKSIYLSAIAKLKRLQIGLKRKTTIKAIIKVLKLNGLFLHRNRMAPRATQIP